MRMAGNGQIKDAVGVKFEDNGRDYMQIADVIRRKCDRYLF